MENIVLKLDIPEEYQIKNSILNELDFDISKIEGSYSYETAAAHAIELKKLYDELNSLFPELFPWSCTKDEYLEMHLKTFGLTRREAIKAEGYINITGKIGARLDLGVVVISRLGIKYKTVENGLIRDTGEARVKVECNTAGTTGNCGIGDIVAFEIANTDIYTVTNLESIKSGADIEGVEVAKDRMHLKASTPAHSGNKNNYLLWVKSVPGVGKVKVWGAGEKTGVTAGQVEIMISDYEYKLASSELVEDAQNYIDSVKIVNADVTVRSFLAKNITIDGVIKISSGSNLEAIKENFIKLLEQKLTEDNFLTENILSYGKVGNLLFDIDGVIDYKNLTLNDASSSVELTDEELAIISEVSFTEWT